MYEVQIYIPGRGQTTEDLRNQRSYYMGIWLSGVWASEYPRWEGDDGRRLNLAERDFWPDHIKAAQQAEFERLDALYEEAKVQLAEASA